MTDTPPTAWKPLDEELAAWTAAGRTATLWWRDDDAVTVTDTLKRLGDLSATHGVPVTLAVIPAQAKADLVPWVAARPLVDVAPHGLSHANHSGPDDRGASEFPASRPLDQRLADVAEGWRRLVALFGAGVPLPLLVAPFNKVADDLAGALPSVALSGLSVHGPRAGWRPVETNAPPVAIVNTHVDVLRWRPDAEFIGVAKAIDRLTTALRVRRLGVDEAGDGRESDEPVGLLTHHRVHPEPLWPFLDALLARLRHPAVRWAGASTLIEEGRGA